MLAVASTFAIAAIWINAADALTWKHGIAHLGDEVAIVSEAIGIHVVSHAPARLDVGLADDEVIAAYVTVQGALVERRLDERPLPAWASRPFDPDLPNECTVGLPFKSFHIAWSRAEVGLREDLNPPGSIKVRGGLVHGSPALLYANESGGWLIPYSIRPLPFLGDVAILTLVWLVLFTIFAKAWPLVRVVLERHPGACPACGYHLPDAVSTCPRCTPTRPSEPLT